MAQYQATIFKDVGKLKTQSLSTLGASALSVEKLFKDNGVPMEPGYLCDSLELARTLGGFWAKDGEDMQTVATVAERGKLLVAARLAAVAKCLDGHADPLLQEKLEKISAGNLDPSYAGVSEARNTLFELEMLARLKQFAELAKLQEEPGADIFFVHRYILMQMECKYLTSDKHKSAVDLVRKACEQLDTRKHFGIVALEIDSHARHPDLREQPTTAAAYEKLSEYTAEFLGEVNREIQDVVGQYSKPRGLIFTAHTNAMIASKNCIDVGMCYVGNSAVNLPSHYPDFALLISIASGLREGLPA